MATALYRRYRPESFGEMIGQQHVTEPLMAALRQNKIGHAYLFSGPRGCGKTTSARVLARCLNCAQGPTDNPCGACESCVELSRVGGGSIDVVEIDAASHGGVDDARDLRERAAFAPARDRYKIFIIDEAHMVTSQGFNALLKIVEEPPEYLKFIFATTEPEKVLGTIRSRTHHYPFRLIAPGAMIDYVEQLCEQEQIRLEQGVASLLVRAGGGSARDTLSILDQLIAGSDGSQVTLERSSALLGFTSRQMIDDVVLAIARGDGAAAFASAAQVVQSGQDPRRFTEDLLERMRDLIVIAAAGVESAATVLKGTPPGALEQLQQQTTEFAPGKLSEVAAVINDALNTMGGATAPKLQLELMLARALLVTAAGKQARAAQQPPAGGSQSSGVSQQQGGVAQSPQDNRESVSQPLQPQKSASEGNKTAAPAVTLAPASAAPVSAAQSVRATADSGARHTQQAPHQNPVNSAQNGAAVQSEAVENGESISDIKAFLKQNIARIENSAPSTDFLADPPSAQPSAANNPQAQQLPQTGFIAPHEQLHEQQQTVANQAQSPQDGSNKQSEQQPAPLLIEGEELFELWQTVQDELADEQSAAAVAAIVPQRIENNKFTIGARSSVELAAFKAFGAQPVREIILETLGVRVEYIPKRLAESAASQHETAARVSAEPPGQPQPPQPPQQVAGVSQVAGDSQLSAQPQQVAGQAVQAQQAPQLPGVERYGDSVIRNVFSARVVSESPLDGGFAEAGRVA